MDAEGGMTLNAIQCTPVEVHVEQSVLDAIGTHVSEDTTLEYGGVLVGSVARDGRSVLVTASIRGVGAVSEDASLTFTHETWDTVNEVLERQFPGEQMVGWYHSHPRFGIFLSEYDLFIHRNFFREPWQVAYVVDPIQSL